MKFFDAHLHFVGNDLDELTNIAKNSPYKDIYIGYKTFSNSQFDYSNYFKTINGCFLMPACLKETNITKTNNLFRVFLEKNNATNIYSVPFIQDKYINVTFNFIGLKEHFYLHNCFQWEQRKKSYEYLNDNHKLLILHCDNINRIDYVKFLHEKYPKMIIQIAHLGCFQNLSQASFLVIDKLAKLNNIYFDSSAVYNIDVLNYALKKVPQKILFGTDIPYIGNNDYFKIYEPLINNCNLEENIKNMLLYKNAQNLLSELI